MGLPRTQPRSCTGQTGSTWGNIPDGLISEPAPGRAEPLPSTAQLLPRAHGKAEPLQEEQERSSAAGSYCERDPGIPAVQLRLGTAGKAEGEHPSQEHPIPSTPAATRGRAFAPSSTQASG